MVMTSTLITAPTPLPTTLSPRPESPPAVQIPPKSLSPFSAMSSTITNISAILKPITSPPKPSPSFRDDFNQAGLVPPDVYALSQCDPPCQHGGKCVESNGNFSCDCSSTPFWGQTCSRGKYYLIET